MNRQIYLLSDCLFNPEDVLDVLLDVYIYPVKMRFTLQPWIVKHKCRGNDVVICTFTSNRCICVRNRCV